jgi:L-ascorbate metabolism protein UlaG (beta-lactamase superfamily)
VRVTKHPQSCLVVESAAGSRLLLDPGNFAADALSPADLGPIDAVLVTHRHPDHCDPRLLDPLREADVPIVANADAAEVIGEGARVVTDGQRFELAGVDVIAHDLPHQVMVDGSPGPPNTGFLLDGRLFHPGDGLSLDGVTAPSLALPIAGPSTSFHDAYRFAIQLGASTVIPVHYAMFVADPRLFADKSGLGDVRVLADGQATQL